MHILSFLCDMRVIVSDDDMDVFFSYADSSGARDRLLAVTADGDLGDGTAGAVYDTIKFLHSLVYCQGQSYCSRSANVVFATTNMACVRIPNKHGVTVLDLIDMAFQTFQHDNNSTLATSSPLFVAINQIHDNPHIVEYLVDRMDVNIVDRKSGNNCLLAMLHHFDLESAKHIVKRVAAKTDNINHVNVNGNNALFLCIIFDNPSILDVLLSDRCDIDVSFPVIDNISVGVLCVVLNKLQYFKKILSHPSLTSTDASSIAKDCVLYDRASFIDALVQLTGSEIDIDADENLAVICVAFGKIKMLRKLRDRMNAKRSLIRIINIMDVYDIDNVHNNFTFLIERCGADINDIDPETGNTVVMSLVERNMFSLANLVMQFNPDIAVENRRGETLLTMLIEKNCVSLVRLCMLSGAMPASGAASCARAVALSVRSRSFDSFVELLSHRGRDFFSECNWCLMCCAGVSLPYKVLYYASLREWRAVVMIQAFFLSQRVRILKQMFRMQSHIGELIIVFLGTETRLNTLNIKLKKTRFVYENHRNLLIPYIPNG